MSGRPDHDSSAPLMDELRGLRYEADLQKRTLRSWRIVVEASGAGDFSYLWDFALEHGLILSCDDAARGARRVSWMNPIDGSEMVWIPPGPFIVGPKGRRAEAKGFSLARHPVTNAQFKRFLDATGYEPPAGHRGAEYYLSHWGKGDRPLFPVIKTIPSGEENHPVVRVSFIDALYYCRWAGLALPSEWQWEKAARGPDGRPYPWGAHPPEDGAGRKLANIRSKEVKAVGRYPRTRTAYGCEDMIGNVSEWCQRTPQDEVEVVPPAWPELPDGWNGPGARAAVRGSCFLRSASALMTCWHRRKLSLTRRNHWVGFRPAFFLACRPAP